MLGFAEQLEFLAAVADDELERLRRTRWVEAPLIEAARATCDFYIDAASAARRRALLGHRRAWPGRAWRLDRAAADPFNDHEPVDSSAAAIGAQGLLRLGRLLARTRRGRLPLRAGRSSRARDADRRRGPYLSTDAAHQGLLLHSVYHRPNGWDHVPAGVQDPRGESSQWGDYHLREAALLVRRLATNQPYLTFFGGRHD